MKPIVSREGGRVVIRLDARDAEQLAVELSYVKAPAWFELVSALFDATKDDER